MVYFTIIHVMKQTVSVEMFAISVFLNMPVCTKHVFFLKNTILPNLFQCTTAFSMIKHYEENVSRKFCNSRNKILDFNL